jgi:protein-S-isoprenylcysteine O-methyltransferase Ste14
MVAGALGLLAIYLATFALYVVVPGRWVDGYVTDDAGRTLRYHLNGLIVFILVVGGAVALAALGVVPADFIYVHRVEMLVPAVVLGLVFTAAIVLPAPPTGKSFAADLYLGRWKNPQWLGGRVDAKMFLYLIGAVMLELCLLSFAAHHYSTYRADPNPGVALYVALFSFFLVEYLFFERVHLYTYDFVAERVGFKLGWGCLAFYPFFYCVGLWFAASQPNPHVHPAWLVTSAVVFFCGWGLARGANLQKFHFKIEPQRTSFGPLPQRALAEGDRRILVGGLWGLSRHINYLGELLMASGLALSLGYPGSIWPWLYPLYYVGLLVPRQIDDDKRCAAKYGSLWSEYQRSVRYRIVPWLY